MLMIGVDTEGCGGGRVEVGGRANLESLEGTFRFSVVCGKVLLLDLDAGCRCVRCVCV